MSAHCAAFHSDVLRQVRCTHAVRGRLARTARGSTADGDGVAGSETEVGEVRLRSCEWTATRRASVRTAFEHIVPLTASEMSERPCDYGEHTHSGREWEG